MTTKGSHKTIKTWVVRHGASGKFIQQGRGQKCVGHFGTGAPYPPTSTVPVRKHGGPSTATSPTRLAAQEFARKASQLPGVLRVEEYGATPSSSARRFLVVVPTLNSRVSEQVLELKNDLLDQHAGAQLEVRLKGLQERGLGPNDAHLVS